MIKICRKCGAKNPLENSFCEKCGSGEFQTNAIENKISWSSSNSLILKLIIVALLVALTLLSFKQLQLIQQQSALKDKKINNTPIEQTVCFYKPGALFEQSINLGTRDFTFDVDNATLVGGKCNGRTLIEMNKDGWKMDFIFGEYRPGNGVVLTRERN